MEKQTSTEIIDKALLEASLRLAWYTNAYGAIPDGEKVKLALAGHGLRQTAETDALLY